MNENDIYAAQNMYDAWDNGDRHEIRQQFARREEITRMAREAGFEIDCCSLEWHNRIERFAALVAAAERERVLELEDVAKEALDAIHYWTWHGETQESTALLNVSHDNLRDVLYPVGNDQMYRPDEE